MICPEQYFQHALHLDIIIGVTLVLQLDLKYISFASTLALESDLQNILIVLSSSQERVVSVKLIEMLIMDTCIRWCP